MALKSPFPSMHQHPETNLILKQPTDFHRSKEREDRSTPCSVFTPTKQAVNNKTSNSIKTPEHVKADQQTIVSDTNHVHSITADLSSMLSNQESNEILARALTLLKNSNERKTESIKTDTSHRTFSAHQYHGNDQTYEPAVSHIPIMSSSSSSSSLSVPSPVTEIRNIVPEQSKAKSVAFTNVDQYEGRFKNIYIR